MTMMTMTTVTLKTDNLYKFVYDQVIITIDTHNKATDDADDDDDDNVTKML